ncbi:MAG: DUF4124 domain-containing protein [Woeseiaceae bacterium]|nr:DUF4124 domain-containing protein [Woeseiaceae bacterium]
MIRSRLSPLYLCLACAFAAPDAAAGIYRCVDDTGAISYSQTPCAGQQTTQISSASSRARESTGCGAASEFATTVAGAMRRGTSSADVMNRYGGVDSLSGGAINIINYVYSFRHNSDILPERIAALAQNKCRARSFGDLRCGDLPPAWAESSDACKTDEDESGDAAAAVTASTDRERRPQPALAASAASAAADDARTACQAAIDREVDSINDSMRGGYTSLQGEQYRQRLRDLRQRRAGC